MGRVVVFGQKWLYSGTSGCIRAKVVDFGKMLLYSCNVSVSGKVVVFRQKSCICANVVLIGQSCGIWAKVVVFGQKWLFLGTNGCFRAKVAVFGQKWLYSAKVVEFGQK